MSSLTKKRQKYTVVIAVFVAALHFITGTKHGGLFWIFINGYLIDILLPFSFYFLFTIKAPPFKSKLIIGLAIVIGTFTVETVQYFGYYLFGCTFDYLDYLAYLSGVLLALIIDRFIVMKLIGERERD